MTFLFKISEFSRLSQVSVKALRYYDQFGLLKPAFVDPDTGYRYYSADQLLNVQRILAFKEHGFTLEQMMPMFDEELKTNHAHDLLFQKRMELEKLVQEAQTQIQKITERIQHIDRTPQPTAATNISVKKVEPQLVASIRDVVPRPHLCLLINEIKQYLQGNSEMTYGNVNVIWHEFLSNEMVDIEVAIPLKNEIASSKRIKIGKLTELPLAASYTHYCDPYRFTCQASKELAQWIAENGYRLTDSQPFREVYITSDEDIYGHTRIAELQIPVQTA